MYTYLQNVYRIAHRNDSKLIIRSINREILESLSDSSVLASIETRLEAVNICT